MSSKTRKITLSESALDALVATAVKAAVSEVFEIPAPTGKPTKKAKSAKAPAGKPAKAAKAKKGTLTRDGEFVEWLRETAEQRAARKRGNKAQAEWMRSEGLVPSGQAWHAVSNGERDVARLRKLNAKDGLSVPAKGGKKGSTKTPAKASKAKATKAPEVEAPAPEVDERKAAKAAKRRSKAGRKAYRTRVANGNAVRGEGGKFVSA